MHNDNDMYGRQIVAIYSGDVPPNNEMISESSYVIDLRWEQFIIAEIRTCVRAGPPAGEPKGSWQTSSEEKPERESQRQKGRQRRRISHAYHYFLQPAYHPREAVSIQVTRKVACVTVSTYKHSGSTLKKGIGTSTPVQTFVPRFAPLIEEAQKR